VPYPPRRSLLQVLLDRDTDLTSIESHMVDSRIASKVKDLVGDLPLGALGQGGILRLMPYTITIR